MSTTPVKRRTFSPEFAGKVTVDRTSLQMSDTLAFDEWLQLGRQLTEVGDSMAWWVGDWIEQGTVAYGAKYEAGLAVMGLAESTLKSYAYLSRRFTTFRRRNLSWGHHEVVAALVEAEQDAFLDSAEKHAWSVRDLRDAVRDSRALPVFDETRITLEQLKLVVPHDTAERWKTAADRAGLAFPEWCAKTLDAAAA